MHPTVPPRTRAPWSSSIGTDGRHASEPVVFFVGMLSESAFANIISRLMLHRHSVRRTGQAVTDSFDPGCPSRHPRTLQNRAEKAPS
jgi:hypothetical protein